MPDVTLSHFVFPTARLAKPVSYIPNMPPLHCGDVALFLVNVLAVGPYPIVYCTKCCHSAGSFLGFQYSLKVTDLALAPVPLLKVSLPVFLIFGITALSIPGCRSVAQ